MRGIKMDKTEAFKIVLEELRKCPLFCGTYDARYGHEDFMYGIQTVMEAIAARTDDESDENYFQFSDEFLTNMIKSEKKAERAKLEKKMSGKEKNNG